jgi:hypothetical protein
MPFQVRHTRAVDREKGPMGTRIARVVALDDDLAPLVDFAGNVKGPLRARLALAAAEAMRLSETWPVAEVLLVFVDHDLFQPVITGIVAETLPCACQPELEAPERLVLEAARELVLQCGDARIVLRSDGSLVLAAREILSRARQQQKIRGGTVAIN